jgi:ankyrin repeat protein
MDLSLLQSGTSKSARYNNARIKLTFLLSYATTNIEKTSKDTLSVTRDVHKELQVYQQAAVEVMERTATEVQKNADLTEEMRDLMESFLLTMKSSVISGKSLTLNPNTDKNLAGEIIKPALNDGQDSKEEENVEHPIDPSALQDVHSSVIDERSKTLPVGRNVASKAPDLTSSSPTVSSKIDTDDPTPSLVTTLEPKSKSDDRSERIAETSSKIENLELTRRSDDDNKAQKRKVNPTLELAVEAEDELDLSKALRTAAWNGNVEMLDTLLEIGANIDSFDKFDGTALRMAASAGRVEAVEVLLQRGANPNLGKGKMNSYIWMRESMKLTLFRMVISNFCSSLDHKFRS